MLTNPRLYKTEQETWKLKLQTETLTLWCANYQWLQGCTASLPKSRHRVQVKEHKLWQGGGRPASSSAGSCAATRRISLVEIHYCAIPTSSQFEAVRIRSEAPSSDGICRREESFYPTQPVCSLPAVVHSTHSGSIIAKHSESIHRLYCCSRHLQFYRFPKTICTLHAHAARADQLVHFVVVVDSTDDNLLYRPDNTASDNIADRFNRDMYVVDALRGKSPLWWGFEVQPARSGFSLNVWSSPFTKR